MSSRPFRVALVALTASLSAPAGAGTSLSGEVRVTQPESACASSIAIDPVDPNKIVIATQGPASQVRMQRSPDGGRSWSQSDLPLGNTMSGPSVAWSSDGRYAYATALAYCVDLTCELEFYRSADAGATWDDLTLVPPGDPRRSLSQSADRERVHVDQSVGSPYRDRVYVLFDDGGVLQLMRSSNFGDTWGTRRFSTAADELGSGGGVATTRQGNVFVAWPARNSRTIRVRKSTDGGQTFEASVVVAVTQAAFRFPVPAQDLRTVRLYVAAGADLGQGAFAGSVYLAWTDASAATGADPRANHARIQVAYSRDGGATWAVGTPHPTADVLAVDRFNPYLAVGADGTVHVVFYDTRNSVDRSGVDLYYAYSTDGAQTWSAPVRITAVTSPHAETLFQFGDYNGLDIVLDELVASYADNRSESGTSGDSMDVYAAGIAAGGSAPAAGRVLGSEGVEGPPLTVARNADGFRLDLRWAGACGGATDYAIYEGALGDPDHAVPLLCSTGGSTSATVAPSPAARFYLVVPTVSGAEGSYGLTGGGVERRPAPAPCLPQRIGTCP